MGAEVVLLDSLFPFTAARARNDGFKRLCEIQPHVIFVQFVDGDCELAEGWLSVAEKTISSDASIGVVCGHLRELHPEASLYNRLGDIEWRRPTGDIEHCGGIFMVRVDFFKQVGGFDPTISAGEEPDLCCRLRAVGMRIVRVEHAMATHDLNMMSFSQWWKRSVRGGYGALKLTLFGPTVSRRIFLRQVTSVLIWGIAMPIAIAGSIVAALTMGHTSLSIGFFAIGLCIFIIQAAKIATHRMRCGTSTSDAVAYGIFMILWKFAAVVGFAQCLLDRLRNSQQSTGVAPVRVFHKTK